MISNERPSPYARLRRQQDRPARPEPRPRPVVPEMVISEESVQIERKQIQMKLKENRGGRFLRIVETNGVHFNSIVIPASGLVEFQKCLASIVATSKELPSEPDLPPAQ